MSPSAPAFVPGAVTSAFTPKHVYSSTTTMRPVIPVAPATRRSLVCVPVAVFMEPQPGDPGSKLPKPVAKGTGMQKTEEKKENAEPQPDKDKPQAKADDKKAGSKTVTQKTKSGGGRKLPVIGSAEDLKRGIDLLREDLFKSAPERAGVGRQDQNAIMKPVYGEPGYKPAAYELVRVSELGISPFPDDANAVGNVGGIEAVKKAANEVSKGQKTAKEIKKEILKIETKVEKNEFDIPDYLKPLPEDTPRKGYTWKNYVGR